MSSLWLLKSKTHTGDTRSEETRTRKYWLRPGVYTIGRPGTTADITIPEDKSISRLHATLTIPSIHEWSTSGHTAPYVDITDSSRYGTLATAKNDLDHEGAVGQTTRAYDRWIVRFGYDSPFKLLTSQQTLCLHPSVPDDLRHAAVSLGLPLTDDIANGDGTTLLVMPAASAAVDGLVLSALLHSRTIVAPSWVHAWEERKVWVDSYPLETDHPVALEYIDAHGKVQTVDDINALLAAEERKMWADLKLLWDKDTMDESLALAAEFAGASNLSCPSTKAARTKQVPSDALVVLTDLNAPLPTGLEGHKKTTPALIIAALMQGLPDLAALSELSLSTSLAATRSDINPGKKCKAAATREGTRSPTKSPPKSIQGSKKTQKRVASEEPSPESVAPRSKRARGASAQPTPVEQSPAAPAPTVANKKVSPSKKISPSKKASPKKKAQGGSSVAPIAAPSIEDTDIELTDVDTAAAVPHPAPAVAPPVSLHKASPVAPSISMRSDVAWKVVERKEQPNEEEQRTLEEEAKEESAMEEEEEEEMSAGGAAADFDAPSPPSASKDAAVSKAAPCFAGNVAYEEGIVAAKPPPGGVVLSSNSNSPNFKAFKRKGVVHTQQSGALMRYNPEPYSGQVTDEGEAFLREQREIAHRNKMAEQTFEGTAAAGKAAKPGARRTTKKK